MAAPLYTRNFKSRFMWNSFPRLRILWSFNNSKSSYVEIPVNHQVEMDTEAEAHMAKHKIHPKKHPGQMHRKTVELPQQLKTAVTNMIEKYPIQHLEDKSQRLVRKLWSRHNPVEDTDLQFRASQLGDEILLKENVDLSTLTREEKEIIENKVVSKVLKKLRKETFHWQGIQYNAQNSFLYLIGRIANDYSVLYRVLSEIKKRDLSFKPISLLDFGSGVGASIWAANSFWQKSLTEHYCVDISEDMNTVARLLLQGSEEEDEMCFPGVYFRQTMAPTYQNKYDITISSFSLCELPTQEERLKHLLSIWRKTNDYMVIIENGTNAGFHLVCEARDFILQCSDEILQKSLRVSGTDEMTGHVFAPCPHDQLCPQALRNDGTPCNYEIAFKPFPFAKSATEKQTTRFSYVILKKGHRNENVVSWPRIVRDVKKGSKRFHCRLCCNNGQLQQSVITRNRHGNTLFKCIKYSKWGDLLPALNKETDPGSQSENPDFQMDQSDNANNLKTNTDMPSEAEKSKETESEQLLTQSDLLDNMDTNGDEYVQNSTDSENISKSNINDSADNLQKSSSGTMAYTENVEQRTY